MTFVEVFRSDGIDTSMSWHDPWSLYQACLTLYLYVPIRIPDNCNFIFEFLLSIQRFFTIA